MKSIQTIYLWMAFGVLLLSACNSPAGSVDTINSRASLPASFGFDKLDLKVVNSSINKTKHTMSVLYGNDLARKCAVAGDKTMHDNELWVLVTRAQQEDGHWFGAKIPADVLSVEEVKAAVLNSGAVTVNYQRFEGASLKLSNDSTDQQNRVAYILSQRPSVMP